MKLICEVLRASEISLNLRLRDKGSYNKFLVVTTDPALHKKIGNTLLLFFSWVKVDRSYD